MRRFVQIQVFGDEVMVMAPDEPTARELEEALRRRGVELRAIIRTICG